MGTVIQLKNQINNSYFQLKESVEDKLVLTEEKIKLKLNSDVELVQKMTEYHIKTGGKRLRALLTLGSAKLCGYSKGSRDVNLAACVELIHSATLMHDDVIDEGIIRRGIPLLIIPSSITSSCIKVALCINSTQAAKFTSLDPFEYPHNFAEPSVNKALNLFPPVLM